MFFELSSLYHHVSCYIYSIDRTLRYRSCNTAWAKVVGLNQESELVGKRVLDLPCFSKQLSLAKILEDNNLSVFEQNKSLLVEEYGLLPYGEKVLLLSQKEIIYDSFGKIQGLVNISFNIDNYQHKLEGISCALSAQLVLSNLLSNMPGHLYWKNREGVYLGCNDQQARNLGFQCGQDVIGKTDVELPWGIEVARHFQKIDQHIMTTGAGQIIEEIAQIDGQHVTLLSIKAPMKNTYQETVGILGISIDITERKNMEKALREAKEVAEQAVQAKEAFIRDIEHDIRTPFCGIYSLAQLLKEDVQDEPTRSLIHTIADCSAELLNYCNNIIDCSRLAAYPIQPIKRCVNLKHLAERVLAMERPAAISRQLALHFHYDANLPQLFLTDEYALQRILINLLSNAIKFTQKGYVKLTIYLVKHTKNGQHVINIIVEDTGIGIPEDKHRAIFEKFTRLTPANHGLYKGLGLGLSHVQHLLDALNGELELDSTPGQGSRFTCTLSLQASLLDDTV